jgi:hypothetical protein
MQPTTPNTPTTNPNSQRHRALEFPEHTLYVTPWTDPVLDKLGHDPRSPYTERYWLPILGPSTILLLRKLATELEQHPTGYQLNTTQWAHELGLEIKGGQPQAATVIPTTSGDRLPSVASTGQPLRSTIVSSPRGHIRDSEKKLNENRQLYKKIGMLLAVLLCGALMATVPAQAQVQGEDSGLDVATFMEENGSPLTEEAALVVSGLSKSEQLELLLSEGVNPDAVTDRSDRPLRLVAEILAVLDPDAARPELASDAEYARKDAQKAVFAAVGQLDKTFGDRLGFPHVSDGPAGAMQLKITVKGLDAEGRAQLAGLEAPGLVAIQATEAPLGRGDLFAIQRAVQVELTKLLDDRVKSWYVALDAETSTIRVGIEDDPAHWAATTLRNQASERAQRAAARAVRTLGLGTTLDPSQLVSVVAVVDPIVPAVDFRESSHIRGGEWAAADNWIPACTTNFLWRRNTSDYRMGTAGHCSTTQGTWRFPRAWRSFDHAKLDGTRNGEIGRVTHNGWVDGTPSDYALMTLPWAATGQSRVMTTGTTWRPVTAVVAEASAGGNFTWCHVGWGLKTILGLEKACGVMNQNWVNTFINYTMDDGSQFRLNGVYCFDASQRGGDSGGPIYYETGDEAWAVGIHHGGTDDLSCFTTVGASTGRHGFSVVTQ